MREQCRWPRAAYSTRARFVSDSAGVQKSIRTRGTTEQEFALTMPQVIDIILAQIVFFPVPLPRQIAEGRRRARRSLASRWRRKVARIDAGKLLGSRFKLVLIVGIFLVLCAVRTLGGAVSR